MKNKKKSYHFYAVRIGQRNKARLLRTDETDKWVVMAYWMGAHWIKRNHHNTHMNFIFFIRCCPAAAAVGAPHIHAKASKREMTTMGDGADGRRRRHNLKMQMIWYDGLFPFENNYRFINNKCQLLIYLFGERFFWADGECETIWIEWACVDVDVVFIRWGSMI